jgi:hypothetical protein
MKKTITTKQYFLTLNLTYYLQAFSVLIFAAVVTFLIGQRGEVPSSPDLQMWRTLVPSAIIISLVTAYFVFRTMVGRIKSGDNIRKKTPVYARAILVRSALLELPGFLASIAAYLTAQLYFAGAAGFIFVLFLILRPTRATITQDLNLSAKEKALLEDDQAIIGEVETR